LTNKTGLYTDLVKDMLKGTLPQWVHQTRF